MWTRSKWGKLAEAGITMLQMATRMELPASGELWHALRNGNVPDLPAVYSADLAKLIKQVWHYLSTNVTKLIS